MMLLDEYISDRFFSRELTLTGANIIALLFINTMLKYANIEAILFTNMKPLKLQVLDTVYQNDSYTR